MPFDWMHAPHPAAPEAHRAQTERALREQAALLRRLGYSKKQATARCKANLDWEYDTAGKPPLSPRQINAVMKSVYG